MSHAPISRLAGLLALGAGALLLVQQVAMASFLDRTAIEATMANPLYGLSAVAYFVSFGAIFNNFRVSPVSSSTQRNPTRFPGFP